MVPRLACTVTVRDPSEEPMNVLTLLGAVAILLGLLGLAGVIGTTLLVEIILIVVGLFLVGVIGTGAGRNRV